MRTETEGGRKEAQKPNQKGGGEIQCSDCHEYLHPEDELSCEVCGALFHWQCGDWQNGKYVCGACKCAMTQLEISEQGERVKHLKTQKRSLIKGRTGLPGPQAWLAEIDGQFFALRSAGRREAYRWFARCVKFVELPNEGGEI